MGRDYSPVMTSIVYSSEVSFRRRTVKQRRHLFVLALISCLVDAESPFTASDFINNESFPPPSPTALFFASAAASVFGKKAGWRPFIPPAQWRLPFISRDSSSLFCVLLLVAPRNALDV